ncbi:hypothetical protein [Phenylobacterium sp.]|jgi:hypothetical protein|uniref:hypothetical protein n=1 Tax=Phenylobacterium sp. TaxID=1871053 RepID=UPI002F952979
MSDRDVERGGPPPLRGVHLAAGAWRALQANWRALWPVGLGYAVFTVASEQVARAAELTTPAPTAAFLAYGFITGLVGALLSGLTLRIVLTPGGRRGRLDGPLVAYVLLVTVVGLTANLAMGLTTQAMPGDAAAAADPGAAAGQTFLVLLAMIAGLWIWLRLTLWPVGMVLGDRAMKPSRSFRLMRRGVWGVIMGSLILGFGPLLVYLTLAIQAREHGPIALVIAAPFLAFFAMATAAVQAEAYRARVG